MPARRSRCDKAAPSHAGGSRRNPRSHRYSSGHSTVSAQHQADLASRSRSMNSGIAEAVVPHLQRVAQRSVSSSRSQARPSTRASWRRARRAAASVSRGRARRRLRTSPGRSGSWAAAATGSARASAQLQQAVRKKLASGFSTGKLLHVREEARSLDGEDEVVRRLVAQARKFSGRCRQ